MLSFAALVLMLFIVALEVVLRAGFSVSLGFADELSAYLLVMLCFFSLSVADAKNGFHRVDFLIRTLPPRGFLLLSLIGEVIALAFFAVFIWQFWKVMAQAYTLNSLAPTLLRTPQWIPMLPMVIGSLFIFVRIAFSIARTAPALARPQAKD